jgi:acyl transferase domain-containing protein/3-hydroxymyristoyl/3-hydroxydecanoyl-(acyl carrier protein) dehydratase
VTDSRRHFSPIAIVGRACVLPGALSPAQLWDAVASGRDLLAPAPPGRWQLDPALALCAPDAPAADRAWSDVGGYVHGFDSIWNPSGFAIDARELEGLDPLVAWTLHCARAARNECRHDDDTRTGAVFGNLGFPSAAMAAFAQGVWLGEDGGDARNRFMAAGTADLLRRALALDAGSHCLDAACASSLYAIKLACDRLQEGSADLMLAGAVQGADDLFLHVGFCALSALSRSGRSRPFHQDADGLVPAEGAAFVALKRLADARRDGDTIHGVIRGIGLSNDGRGKGLLVPAEEGQQRAMRAAYVAAGFGPERVSLLECHATGTPVGDAVELASTGAVFDAVAEPVPVGSLKSNLGHLITTAGAAGLIKVLEAMRAGQRPPTLHVDAPTAALAGRPFRVLQQLEDWPADAPRVAAVSAFGFGGNNAHLIVSQDDPALVDAPEAAPLAPLAPLALVGLGAMVAGAGDREAFRAALASGRDLLDARGEGRAADFDLDLEGLRIPPRDLAQALPQQLAMLHVAREALATTGALPRERTGVFVGMEPDPEVARYGTRWRLANQGLDADALAQARNGVVPALESAAVIGTMPNIPANRLGSQFDFAGPAFTVQAGAASGPVALRIAARAITRGELDAAIVGAVDFSCEAVHRQASPATPGDAAVALLVKRLADAERDGDRILARFDFDAADAPADLCLGDGEGGTDLAARVGHAFAASGLVHVAAAALWPGDDARRIDVRLADGSAVRVSTPAPIRALPRLRCFAGVDKAAVIAALRAGKESLGGPARLVLVADDASFEDVRTRALAHLETGAPAGSGVHFRERPIGGETAFVFAGAGAAYHGMGRELLQHFPQLRAHLAERSRRLPEALAWAYGDPAHRPTAIEQLWGASALSQLHLELTQELLGLKADAWLGYSSGETNALIASGAWSDPDALMTEMEATGLMTRELGGEFAAIERAWGGGRVQWESWTVLAPLADVEAVVAGIPRVHVAIVNGEDDCLVAGDAAGCAEVVARFGEGRCLRLDYPLAVHVPEVAQVADAWLRLHRRPTRVPDGRVYSNAFGRAYVPDSDSCAQAILQQAQQRLDLRPAVLAAWNDGVRVFVEHGPRGAYGRAIRAILGERDAVVVSLDRKGQGLDATLGAVAALLAAGVLVRHDVFGRATDTGASAPRRTQRVAAHPPPVVTPSHASVAEAHWQAMAPAPRLPSVLEDFAAFGEAANLAPPVEPAVVLRPEHVPRLPTVVPMAANEASLPALVQAQLARLAHAQAAFAEQQAQVHQRYLALRQASMQVLLQAGAGGGGEALALRGSDVRRDALPRRLPAPGLEDSPQRIATHVAPTKSEDVATPVASAKMEGVAAGVDPTKAAGVPTPNAPRKMESVATRVAPTTATADAPTLNPPVGPRFTREQLEIHADGRISEIFGPAFAGQDGFLRQVRMPKPPLLLADRVTGLRAEPGSMGKGVIWTESDVAAHGEFLHHGHLPAGVMIECGQADLMLISYLGVDALNRGERVYRLLGCELTYHGDLPRAGDTLRFEIELDGHAAQGDVRLMFFHYDCLNGDRRQLSVRKGQAGFFTDAELAESAGCLWTPEQQAIVAQPRLDPPAVARVPSRLDRAQLEALAAGDGFACFGEGFERLQTHTRTPGIQGGRMLLLDRVTALESAGGPWGRGYLRAELDIDADQWFFDGHFKNDPCMPGTLMFEACLQAMALHLVAQGHSLERDGWRFQPVPGLPYQLQCRGQVTPHSKRLVTEVFVEEIVAGPMPTVYADLLCTVDGLKAFHARRVALQLVPDWPLNSMPELIAEAGRDTTPVAVVDGFRFDCKSLLATAIGRPSDAFGPIYRRFDGTQRVARLPGPPYLFMSRIVEVHGPIGVMQAGARVRVEYDVPADAWYFDRNGCRTMPFAVLLEAALQPCGWLSSYVGSALTEDGELGFRNLDGEGHLLAALHDDCGTLTTEVELTGVSATGGMIIENFAVRCFLGTREVYRLTTVFGFFPPAALADQAGLRAGPEQRELLERASDEFVDLTTMPAACYAPDRPRLADGMLLMLDRVDGIWPGAGAAGLGQLRAVKEIDAGEWFFKAHFFQDPVQPGSLGLEAMLQALQFHMLHAGMDRGIANARFEPIALERAHRWKYRGQVLPHHRRVHTTLEITEAGRDERGVYALANASLWADGKRIYEAEGLGMRIVSAPTA